MLRILFIVLLSSNLMAQQKQQPFDLVVEKFTIKGKITSTSFYQGGAQRPNDLPLAKVPKKEFTIYVVQYFGEDKKPKLVDRITTDKEGNFSVKLQAGKYGFVLDYKNVENGQYLPKGYQNKTTHHRETSSWEISGGRPVEIVDKDVSNIILVQNNRSYCVDCP